ncbi:hypothetical protein DACRYDRAFT_58052, partial [Dacryopinax primogenitus]
SPRHLITVPFGVTYEKIGTIQRRLAWPLHKDDTLSRVDALRRTIFIALFAFESSMFLSFSNTRNFGLPYVQFCAFGHQLTTY